MKQFIFTTLAVVTYFGFMATFCAAMAQEVCPVPLEPIPVDRTVLPDGWLNTTARVITDTRDMDLDYTDNRRIDKYEFISYGLITMTNLDPERVRRQRFRKSVSIKRGASYTIFQDSYDYDVCIEESYDPDDPKPPKAIFFVQKQITPGQTRSQEWYFSVTIEPFGDLNGDGCINSMDLGLLFSEWGGSGVADFNADGVVGAYDMGILLANWDESGDCEEPEPGSYCGDGTCDPDESHTTCPEDCPSNGDGYYSPEWESADDILAFTIDSFGDGNILTENVTVENLKGGLIGIADDTGNSGTKFLHKFGSFGVLGVSGWSPLDTWVVEVYDDDILVGRTSSDSSGPVNNPDGTNNYGNSIYWSPMLEPFKIGDRYILYRWIDEPDIPEYPPSRI